MDVGLVLGHIGHIGRISWTPLRVAIDGMLGSESMSDII